jgi:putative tryptophan/tyrosine transport system substrate-binding protein
MQRRDFIQLILASPMMWPLAVRAQRTDTLHRVGVLLPGVEGDPVVQSVFAIFRQALTELGWTDGKSLQVDVRWGGSDPALFSRYATELIALGPQVLVGEGTPALEALSQKTKAIPIVFVSVTDPVSQGFVANLAHPGGNITGFGTGFFLLPGKWLEMMTQISPPVSRVTVLFNPETTPYAEPYTRAIMEAAKPIAVTVRDTPIHSVSELETMMADLAKEGHGGLVVLPSVFTATNRHAIIALANRYGLPAVYSFPFFAVDGGLMAYGVNLGDVHRRTATYVDRILRGEKPGDLPVQQPTKFDTVVNLKTAKALGITVAPSLLAIADEVIE